ncbi:laminin alpha 3 [Cricetulus griseus]
MAVAPGWALGSSLLTLLLLMLPLLLSPCWSLVAQDPRAAALSLYPPYFNLAQAARIWATATCGERGPEVARPRPELYCKLVGGPTAQGSGHTIQGQFCDYCNSEDSRKAHPATHAIDGSERWWQSPPLSSGIQYNQVNLTLDLGQLFHVAYVLIKFANSPRPDLWVLERSVDFGSTYSPWQYFAHSQRDCLEHFGQEANTAITRDDQALCVTEYSRIVPLENGEVVVSLINGRPGAKNFAFSDTLREFTKATNIRLRFLRTNTLLGHLISKAERDPTVTRRYYYSIKDISIGGRCVCNGHAEECTADNPEKQFRCECQHHTCGETCNRCCAGYNQRHWRPAARGQHNECEACNCHGHAVDCYYDPDVEQQQASLNSKGTYSGGGVCINCQHNTAGVNCEKCAKGYYRPYGVPVDALHGCVRKSPVNFGVTVTWKVFSQKYVTTMAGACAALGLRVPGVTHAAWAPIHSLYAKGVNVTLVDHSPPCVVGPQENASAEIILWGKSARGASQSKEVTFPPRKEPAFVTVPGNGFAEPFSITPGTWIAYIQVEGVLLDYLVLLPRDYYEALILQVPVTEPCAHTGSPQDNCLLYQHLPVSRFSCALACEARHFLLDGELRPVAVRQPTPAHPAMVDLSGREVELRLRLRVPQIGHYVIMLEYATEVDQLFVVDVNLKSPRSALAGQANIYSCKYSILCRSMVIDSLSRTAVYQLLADADIQIKAHMAKFLLTQVTLRGLIPHLGRHVFVIHFYQAEHPTFPTEVFVDGGGQWSGSFLASFCPHLLGCRDQVISDGQVEFDISEAEVAVTVKVPEGKSLTLVRVLVVPTENYDYQILHRTSVDKSSEFVSSCGGDSFYIDPQAASGFCKNSARSLVAFYHNGALPCECHPAGAASRHCSPEGGQCPCRPNVIGRQCTRCAAGYYGFPHCKPCNCGRRLCEEVTGKCLCPPRTVRPQCEVCEVNSFNFHPLAGCEACNCSRKGTIEAAISECDRDSGQCRCKPRITGQRCDKCAPGFHQFPECVPCHCNRDGTEPEVCDPGTGACKCKFVDMMGWRLETADGVDIPVSFNPGSNSMVADLQELPSSVHSASWVSPSSYLGDKVSSYGGYLTYQAKSFGLPGDMVPLEKQPDVQLTGNFRHAGNSAPVSREELMTVLSRLEGLYIRGLRFTETQRLTLGEPTVYLAFTVAPADCDSCVMTLLNDLATMGEELRLMKSKLQGLSVSTGVLEQIRHMETQAKDLRSQLLGFRSTISTHGSKMEGLEKELSHLDREFGTLQEKAQVNSRKAQTLYNNIDQTIQSAKELDKKIKNVIQTVHILLKRISRPGSEGMDGPVGDWSRELAEAQRMIGELRSRDFRKHLREAEAEKAEAQRLLNRVRTWLESHKVENNGLLNNIRDSLSDYEAKLQDLRAVLQEAAAQAKQATGLNHENEEVLGAMQRQMKEMNSLKNDFAKYLATADASLLQTNNLLQQMDKSQKEYESLAAALNGARQELSDKVQKLSRSASKTSLVVEAEKHAQSLQELAKQLEEIKRNTSGDGLVRCAVDAATAYENILNAIKAAEDAANKATSASESALQTLIKEDLPRRAKTLSSDSDELLNEAKITQKKLQQEVSPALNSLQQTLNTVSIQKGLLDTNLTAVRDSLYGLQRGDIDGVINGAKSMVRKANGITSEILDGINPIQTDLGRIKDSYGSARREDFSKALTDANNSDKDEFTRGQKAEGLAMRRLSSMVGSPGGQVVAVPMRFNGKSGVEVRLPNDLEDLKGYTSLSLFLQRPDLRENGGTEDMFVMYLGNKDASKDYIGMAVVDGQLTCVYNLGDREAEVQVDQVLTESENQEAVMDRVKFQRIYQLAILNYTKEATSNKPKAPEAYDIEGDSSNTLLNLDPETAVFYVGGYPADFQLPSRLRFPPYKGCIELDDLNENVLSLYNFKTTFNLNTTEVEPCRRRKEESDRNYFEGTGYARIPTQANAPFPNFIQTIQTTVDRGLLFFAENQDKFISLDIENGNLMVRYKLNSEPPKEKGIQDTVNNGRDHTISIAIGKSRKLMWIYMHDHNIKIEGEIFDFGTYYLGGIPIAIRERFNISTPAFQGCMKNLKKTSGVVRLNDTVGVTKKCSEDWKLVRTASFSRGGQMSFTNLDVPFPDRFQLSFGFQTFQPSGTLLHHQTRTSSLQVTLEDGHIVLSSRDSSSPIFKSPQTYMDGLLHHVSVISDTSGLSQSPEVLDLASKSTKKDAFLGGCSLNRPPFLMLFKGPKRFNKARTFDVNQLLQDAPQASPSIMAAWQDRKSCVPPRNTQATHRALQFGDTPTSHLLFKLPRELLKPRSQFSVDIQTTSSKGLVFYTGTKNFFMALYLSEGLIVFALGAEGKKLRLRSKERYHDGKWHTVVFGQSGGKAHLVVDGLRAQEGNLPGNSTIIPRAQVYLGFSLPRKLKWWAPASGPGAGGHAPTAHLLGDWLPWAYWAARVGTKLGVTSAGLPRVLTLSAPAKATWVSCRALSQRTRSFSDPEAGSPALPVRPGFILSRQDWALGPRVGVSSLGASRAASGAGSGAWRGCRKRRRLGSGWIEAGADTRNGWGGHEPAAE